MRDYCDATNLTPHRLSWRQFPPGRQIACGAPQMYAIVGKTYKLNRRTPHETHKRSDRKMTVDTTPRVIIAGAGPVGTSHLYELDSHSKVFLLP